MASRSRTRLPRHLWLLIGGFFLVVGPGPARAQSPPLHAQSPRVHAQATASEGRELYVGSCASCHGLSGEGTESGPPVTGAGAAGADFMLRTGRMPLADAQAQSVRKAPAFDEAEIAAIVDYVASLGPGPAIPEVSTGEVDLSDGQLLFAQNCAACHGATGNGGAAGKDVIAPSLHQASQLDIAEAIVVGPGEMPVFAFSDQERDAVAAYVEHLRTGDDPGGADIGGIGPVPEGFIAWGLGMGSLALLCFFIARHRTSGGGE